MYWSFLRLQYIGVVRAQRGNQRPKAARLQPRRTCTYGTWPTCFNLARGRCMCVARTRVDAVIGMHGDHMRRVWHKTSACAIITVKHVQSKVTNVKWFAVYLKRGVVQNVVQVAGPGTDELQVEYVQAKDKEHAKRRGYNLYCAKKKKLAVERLRKEGKCSCGRHNDRVAEGLLTCSVCALRRKKYDATPIGKPRDEVARTEAHQTRQRDRSNEMRLTVLVEVQKAWQNCRIAGQFTRWLDKEVEECLKPRTVAAE